MFIYLPEDESCVWWQMEAISSINCEHVGPNYCMFIVNTVTYCRSAGVHLSSPADMRHLPLVIVILVVPDHADWLGGDL